MLCAAARPARPPSNISGEKAGRCLCFGVPGGFPPPVCGGTEWERRVFLLKKIREYASKEHNDIEKILRRSFVGENKTVYRISGRTFY